jgi:hypothetical protein
VLSKPNNAHNAKHRENFWGKIGTILSTENLAVCTQVHGTDHNPIKTTVEEKEEGRRKEKKKGEGNGVSDLFAQLEIDSNFKRNVPD